MSPSRVMRGVHKNVKNIKHDGTEVTNATLT